MADYTYLACDLLTDTILAELPLRGAHFQSKLNDVGAFSGILDIADPQVAKLNWKESTERWRTALYVERDGALAWGGIITTRQWDPLARTVTLGGGEFFIYFTQKSFIVADALWPTATDPAVIARSLMNTAQAKTAGNIGITVGSETTPNTTIQNWKGNQKYSVGQAIMDMSKLANGFDFALDVDYDASLNRTRKFRLFYPRRGRSASVNHLSIDLGSPKTVNYPWPEDDLANTVYAIGGTPASGTGNQTAPQATSQSPGYATSGYPRLENVVQCSDVIDGTALQNRADAFRHAVENGSVLPTITIRADEPDCRFGEYVTGDSVRIFGEDDFFTNPSLDVVLRIVAWDLKPGDQGDDDTVDLVMNQMPTMV